VRTYRAECARLNAEAVHLDGPTDTLGVFSAYRAGEKAARIAVSKMCDSLGFAMAQVSAVIDPQAFIIGGGTGGGFNLFSDELRSAYHRYCLAPCMATRILPASLGNDAAIYGCAYQALLAAKA
jgi:glucokinase